MHATARTHHTKTTDTTSKTPRRAGGHREDIEPAERPGPGDECNDVARARWTPFDVRWESSEQDVELAVFREISIAHHTRTKPS